MAMFGQFFRWLFGIKEKDEESSIENNTSDVQKEQHNEIFKLKTEVIKLKKEARASRERNEKSEQTMRNLNSRLSDLEDADPYEKNNTDGSDIEINPYEKERRKREDKKSKKKIEK